MPSPTPKKKPKSNNEDTLTFYEALDKVLDGKKITKLEWDDENYYGHLVSTLLKLHTADGKTHDWIVSEGDIKGTDWVVL